MFDCIDFNPELRWIDVMNEIAFTVMDLEDRDQATLANRFLNRYLQTTGDYAGLSVFTYYKVYRALVRAKVDAIRLKQEGLSVEQSETIMDEFETYLGLAERYTLDTKPKLWLMRGVSASGKTTVSQLLLEQTGAIRIRSDIERKRLFGFAPDQKTDSALDSGIYTAEASRKTYDKLLSLSNRLLGDGYTVIVDAAFLTRIHRDPFYKLAEKKGVPVRVLEVSAPESVLRKRIEERRGDASEADMAVLQRQLEQWKGLDEDEQEFCVTLDNACGITVDDVRGLCD